MPYAKHSKISKCPIYAKDYLKAFVSNPHSTWFHFQLSYLKSILEFSSQTTFEWFSSYSSIYQSHGWSRSSLSCWYFTTFQSFFRFWLDSMNWYMKIYHWFLRLAFVFFLISWKSRKQHKVSRSSIESKYHTTITASCEIIWLKSLLNDFLISNKQHAMLFWDNNAILRIATNSIFHEKTKQIELDCHFVSDKRQQ